MAYQIIFNQGYYSQVDAIADTYEQAEEIRAELTAQMFANGERDFYYIIKEIKEETEQEEEDIFSPDLWQVIGR